MGPKLQDDVIGARLVYVPSVGVTVSHEMVFIWYSSTIDICNPVFMVGFAEDKKEGLRGVYVDDVFGRIDLLEGNPRNIVIKYNDGVVITLKELSLMRI